MVRINREKANQRQLQAGDHADFSTDRLARVMGRLMQWLNREKPPRSFPLSSFEKIRHELRPCDVVLVEGRSRVSEVIRWLTNSPWTHAALYIGRIYDIEEEDLRTIVRRYYPGEDSDPLVIESLLGHGTVVRRLDSYEFDHLRLCRPDRLSHAAGKQVIRYVISRLGADYDVRQIFDLARFLLPWRIMPKRWASTLFAHQGNRRMKAVCSTMIAEAFGYVQFPILPLVKQTEGEKVQLFRRNPRLCTPSDFDYSPYFEIIKYSFLDFCHDEYHLLPWEGTAVLTRDEADHYIQASAPGVEEVEGAITKAVSQASDKGKG